MTLTLTAAARTHIGQVRKRNEDAVYAGRVLFAVADGLGGHTAGDTASTAVINTLRPYDQPAPPDTLPAVLGGAIHQANTVLRNLVAADPALRGMGTTLVALMWSEDQAVLANIGDSRAYLLRDGTLRQITEDHTYAHLLADAADVPTLPERISRYLDGLADGRSPDISYRDLRPGDRLLLCSDGLSGVVPTEDVLATLSTVHDREDAADRLVALANELGGPDNITVIVVDVADHG
jgi:serine/threonine protein phosphatase PrpC